MKQDIGFIALKLMSVKLLRSYGLDLDTLKFWQMYYGEFKLPLVVDSEHVRIWIDRYYLAYQETGKSVVYLYISKVHAEEEFESYYELTKCREYPVRIPQEIDVQLSEAMRYMESTHKTYWIKQNYMCLCA